MPELPEVETIRQDLHRKVLDKKIIAVEILHGKTLHGQGVVAFQNELLKKSFTDIERVGKLLIFSIKNSDNFLLAHLKMTGQFIYCYKDTIVAGGHSFKVFDKTLPSKHTRVVVAFADNSKLFFNDSRLFGYLKIVDKKEKDRLVGKYGIEPLAKNFTLKNFTNVLVKRKTSIKALLLNQEIIAGIGNIYADEALHMAGILPGRLAVSLSAAELKKLHASIEKIIRTAIKYRGTTFNNYVDSEGNRGNFSKHLKVYDRTGEKCLSCKTGIIEKTRVAGRGTHFCKICQK